MTIEIQIPVGFWDHYQSLYQRFRKNFKRAAEDFEVEGVHDLRVDIKRFRAFFHLIESINPIFQAKLHFKPIRRLFKSAGPLRDAHVQQASVQKWSAKLELELSEYFNYLKQKEMKGRKDFSKCAKKFDFQVFNSNWIKIRQMLMYISADYIQHKSEEKFQQMVLDIIQFKNNQDFKEDDYHSIRILSKEARYILEILQKCFPAQEAWEELNKSLRSLHQALGKWHDCDIALQFLEGFFLDYTGSDLFSSDSYSQYSEGLIKEKQAMLNRFETHWKKFLNLWSNYG